MDAKSLSGNERNRLFMRRGTNYEEMTLVSGADFLEDGRGFVLLDYDKDGFVDMATISTVAPRFRLMKNQIGDLVEAKPAYLNIELIGGHQGTEPTNEWSSRDPIGATVTVTCAETNRIFQLACGEGLASQNSNRIHIGLGKNKAIDKLVVSWPSGKTTTLTNVEPQQLLRIYENEADKP